MSRIDELLRDLAPDGVEFKPLGEVGTFIRGNGLQKADLTEQGVPAIHYGQIHTFYGTWTRTTKSFAAPELAARLRRAKDGDLVIATTSEDDAAVAKATAWLGDGEVAISSDAYIYRHTQDPRYVAYFFQSTHFQDQKAQHITGTKVRRVSGDALARVRIPLPPREVQAEIVRILDQFSDLETSLQEELSARMRQFTAYRSALLREASPARAVRVGDALVPVSTPRGILRQRYGEGTLIPIVDQGQGFVVGYTDRQDAVVRGGPFILFGDHTRQVKWIDFDFALGADGVRVFRPAAGLDAKFAYFAVSDLEVPSRGYNRHWTLLRDMEISVPDAVTQRRIVEVLNCFDAIVNDQAIGLPAELRVRRKQYEYYRDKLLTFAEAS
jgi:type I restriction enzyme S subunit